MSYSNWHQKYVGSEKTSFEWTKSETTLEMSCKFYMHIDIQPEKIPKLLKNIDELPKYSCKNRGK